VSHDPLCEAIIKAWTDAGIRPDYHKQMQQTLRKKWPVLAKALDDAAQARVVRGSE